MVLRERRINNKSDEVQIHCSFCLVDVRAFFKLYAEMSTMIRNYPQTEYDVRYWMEHDGRVFLSWPDKWREQLSGWAFAVAVRNNLLVPTAADENKYLLADFLFAKRGRPPKDD